MLYDGGIVQSLYIQDLSLTYTESDITKHIKPGN